MRVAHYMTGLWQKGGVRSYVRRLTDAQRAAGHDVSLFDLSRHRHETGWPEVAYVDDERALFKESQRRGIQILHAHTLVESARIALVPLIRTLHGHEPYCPSGGKFLARHEQACTRAFNPLGCALAHVLDRCGSARPANILSDIRRTQAERHATRGIHVITVSHHLREQMISAGYLADQIHTLHPPAGPIAEYTDASAGEVRFAFLGRLTAHKGAEWMLRAAAHARTRFSLDIGGDGNALPDLKALCQSLDVSDRVTFHGWLVPDEVNGLLDASRALIFPSLWPEPAGLVAFDAMARGRAVIASRIGGIPELIGEANALLVPPGNIEALAAAMDHLASDVTLARNEGRAGYQRLRQFTVEAHLNRLHELYSVAIDAHRMVRAS